MADNNEFKMMGFRELEEYRKKEGTYHEQDPRNRNNYFDTDDDVKRAYRIKMGLQERKEIDAKKDTKGKLEALPVVRDEEVKKVFEEIKKEEVKKGNRPKELKAAKGASISKQMEMFEDGGLKDEGGMVDEVSGNDVPLGSTREEVRDDIPAQLSEGEFVFPADVVRFIGLEKLMRLRQEAKQGLKQMEAMGQMGNSDEATMPDDLPFDETDLDIEDDLEYNVGGYVAPQVPNINESIETTSPMGMQQIQSGLGRMYTPTGQPPKVYAPANYEQFLGPSAGGAPRTQNVRYFNASTGQTRMIPHVVNADGSLGKTIYPIPNGFVRQDEAPKEEAKTVVESTKVKPVESGDDGGQGSGTSAVDPAGDPLSYSSMFDMDNLDKQMSKIGAMQLSTLGKAGITQGVIGAVTGNPERNQMKLGAITPTFTSLKEKLGLKGKNLVNATKEQRNAMAAEVERVSAAIDRLTTNITFSKDEKGNTISTESNKSTKDVIDEVNAMADKYGLDKIDTKNNVNLSSKIGQKVAEINNSIQDQPTTDMTKGPDVSIVDDPSEPVSDSTDVDDGGFDGTGMGGGGEDPTGPDDDSGQEDAIAKGSLVTKRKASGKLKKKYMKRGGLASR